MNRNLLKLQKIKEANQSLENRYLIKEQTPPAPPAPAPAPSTTTPPPSDPNTPKKLTPEQEKDLKERLKKDEVMSCSLDKGTKEGPYEYEDEKFFYRKGDPIKYTKDFWCKKED
jgi:colicin import membrane protein